MLSTSSFNEKTTTPEKTKEEKYDDEESESNSDSESDISIVDDSEGESDSEEENDEEEYEDVIGGKKKKQEDEEDEEEEEEEDEDEEDEDKNDNDNDNMLQKFEKNMKSKVISDYHPELKVHSYEEILALTTITRNENGMIEDPLHKTIGILTKYEYARVLGERSKQLSIGADPLVQVDDYIADEYTIAKKELYEKKIPFIVERPLPDGTAEYWKLEDLEILM
jgi:DNA-directed RNA polymerase subunit K/omega